jgi:hypothetical protein
VSAYAINPKWFMERPNRVIPIDVEWVKNGFFYAIRRMYTPNEASVI